MALQKKAIQMLVILDGFGWREQKDHNAIAHAHTPHLDRWMQEYPHALLHASGKAVGLPEGYIGNSEVGHLTIGAGRIIPSPLEIVNRAIADESFFENAALSKTLQRVKENNSTLHIIGMLSDAGVHADMQHLFAFLKAARKAGIEKIVVHPFLDGRDSPPKTAEIFLSALDRELKKYNAKIGSITGRFYAMDRNKNWQRTQQTYEMITQQQDNEFSDWKSALDQYYNHNITDEFVPPTQLDPTAVIKDGDGVICINFRPDRVRQLAASFSDPAFDAFDRKKITLAGFTTPFSYDNGMHTNHMLTVPTVTNTLMHVLAEHGKTTFAIAETEKYAHVTYFFNGGKEEPEKNETQLLIATQDDVTQKRSPEMAAEKITQAVIDSLHSNPCDFYLINYANADIIGHTGDFQETVTAVECIDRQLGILYKHVVSELNGTLYITADHGNAEEMWDEKTHQPRTAHTINPVPFLWINQNERNKKTQLPLQQLRDIAPFILEHMGIQVPKEMQK